MLVEKIVDEKISSEKIRRTNDCFEKRPFVSISNIDVQKERDSSSREMSASEIGRIHL